MNFHDLSSGGMYILCYLMALETNGAYLDSVTARPDTGSVNWDKRFQASETEYTLRVAENAKNVTLSFKAPAGCTMKIGNDTIDGMYILCSWYPELPQF